MEEIQTYTLLDNASEVTLCDEKLAKRLRADGEHSRFMLTGINGSVEVEGQMIDIVVTSLDGSTEVELKQVKTVKEIPISKSCVPKQVDLNKWSHLPDVCVPELEDKSIELLIGLKEKPRLFFPLECKESSDGEPIAVRYSLGWTVMGPIGGEKEDDGFSVNFTRSTNYQHIEGFEDQDRKRDELTHQLERLWNHDFQDLNSREKVSNSVEDERALRVMEKSAKLVNGHLGVESVMVTLA